MVKPTLQLRKPGFTEFYCGYRSFKELIEDVERHKLVVLVRDEKLGSTRFGCRREIEGEGFTPNEQISTIFSFPKS